MEKRARLLLVFICTFQLVYASSGGGTLGHRKWNCPALGGIGSPLPTDPVNSSPPPVTPATPPYSASPSPTIPPKGSSSSPSVPSYGGAPPSPSSSSSPSVPSPVPSPSSPSVPSPFPSSSSPSVPSYDTPSPVPSSSSPNVPSYGTPPVPSSSSSPTPDSGVPSIPTGSPPSVPGLPGSGTGTCKFWGSHPSSFPDILSIFSSIADLFGSGSSFPTTLGKGLTVQEALTNRRKDGYGTLLREGSAAMLNSLVNPTFSYSPQEVKNQFNAALRSNTAAAVQGAKFKSANEGRLLP